MASAERLRRVLLDQQHGHAVLVDLADDVEDLLDDQRRQPHRRLVEQQQPGLPISARPIASICCSPPDSVPACCRIRSCSRGKLEHSLEIGLIGRLESERTHLEVLRDRHPREDVPALGHVADAAAGSARAPGCRRCARRRR